MAKKEAVGHMACPECGFPDAEVKEDKNGNLYRYCPDCSAQYMTHGRPHKVENLKARMREKEAGEQLAEKMQLPEVAPAAVASEAAPRRRFLI